jgi:hypothetical protein
MSILATPVRIIEPGARAPPGGSGFAEHRGCAKSRGQGLARWTGMTTGEPFTVDPRLVTTRVTSGGWLLHISPATMRDGRQLRWYPPQPVAFALIEAKRYRDRGVTERAAITGGLVHRDDDARAPEHVGRALDCVSDLRVAMTYAFTAIESLANHAIDQLADTATIEVEFRLASLPLRRRPRWRGDSTSTRSSHGPFRCCTTANTSKAPRRGSATSISSYSVTDALTSRSAGNHLIPKCRPRTIGSCWAVAIGG